MRNVDFPEKPLQSETENYDFIKPSFLPWNTGAVQQNTHLSCIAYYFSLIWGIKWNKLNKTN